MAESSTRASDTRSGSPKGTAEGGSQVVRQQSGLRRQPRFQPDVDAQKSRATSRSWFAAIAVHLVVGAILFRTLTFGHGLDGFFSFGAREPVVEHVTYVAPRDEPPVRPEETPVKLPDVPTSPPLRGDEAEATPPIPPPVAPPVAPPVVSPPMVAVPPTGGVGQADTGSGYTPRRPVVGDVPPELRGVRPSFTDARLWGMAVPIAPERGTGAERLDSIISYAIVAAADSLDAIARARGETGRKPGDWTTVDRNGDKWGWDEGGIRLGKVTIPNALLGLLPMNAQMAMSGNPTAIDRERRLAMARQDIMANSRRSVGEAEFRKLVKELAERKEREYQQRQKARKEAGRVITNDQGSR